MRLLVSGSEEGHMARSINRLPTITPRDETLLQNCVETTSQAAHQDNDIPDEIFHAVISQQCHQSLTRVRSNDNWVGFGGLTASYFQDIDAVTLMYVQNYCIKVRGQPYSVLQILLYLYGQVNLQNENARELANFLDGGQNEPPVCDSASNK